MATLALRPEILHRKYKIKNKLARNLLAEFFGTFVLLFIGTSIIAQFILSHEKLNTWIHINIGWGFAITFSVYLVCKLSDAINHYDGGNRTVFGPTGTANIFATYPAPYLSICGAYLDQIVGTGFLALFVVSITDKRNKIPGWIHPLLFGLVLILIGTCFGMNVGYPLNPARDLGPRIFTLFIYGSEVFTYPYTTWFLVPIIAPMIGAVLFAWLYHLCAGMHISDEEYDLVAQHGLEEREVIVTKEESRR